MPIKFQPTQGEKRWGSRQGAAGELKGTVLAAGLGRRMEPLSATHLPKPMFPLGGKVPMVEMWVRRLVDSGIPGISMNLSVLSDTISRHFRDGAKFAADITYVDEGFPSGTFGGVCKLALGREAKRLSPDEARPEIEPFGGSTVIAPSGDIVTNFGADLLGEMYDLHKKAGAACTIVLVPIPWERRKDFGTAIFERPESLTGAISRTGRIAEFIEKDPNSPSNLNNASIYMIEMELIKALDPLRTEARLDVPQPFYDFGKHVFPALLGRLPGVSLGKDFTLWGVQYDGHWFDVGQKRDYLTVNEHLLDGELDVPLPYERLPWGYLGANVSMDLSEVTIIPPVIVGHDCVIESGVVLGPYAVVGDGWTVRKGAHIHHSVLWSAGFSDTGEGRQGASGAGVRFEVGGGVTVGRSILAGGELRVDVSDKTLHIDEDGEARVLPIDYAPEAARA